MPIKGVDPASVPERFRHILEHNPFADHFDLEVVTISPGHATLRFPFKREFTQYQGAVQGGIVVAYADAAMALAIAPMLAQGEDFVTTDLNVQYVRPVTQGPIVAKSEIAHKGKGLIRGRATVEVEGSSVAAICVATFMIVRPRGAAAK